MSEEIIPGFINQVQPPELPVFLAKIEPLTLIKNEPPESDEEIIPDIKDVDLVSYIVPEALIKSETVPETTFETKHIESVETQVFVKTENAPFVKIENITESEILYKPEDAGNKSINKARDQSKMYDWTLKYHCDNCTYKTCRSDDLKRHKIIHLKEEKIQYFYCHHCSHKTKRKDNLIAHISRHFRKGNVTFHCFICDFATLKRNLIITHIRKHPKFKLLNLSYETKTMIHEQYLKYNCEKCDYKTHSRANFHRHKIIHLKPEEIQYFYCYHCSHKSKLKADLKNHISRHFKKGNIPFHCYMCNFTTLKRDLIITHIKKHTKFEPHEISCETDTEMDNQNLKYHCDNCSYKTYRCDDFKRHKLIHLKQENIQYFYCYHCSYKSKRKDNLRTHISKHFGKENVPFHCYICDFMTLKRDLIITHIKKHTKFKSHEISCDKDTTFKSHEISCEKDTKVHDQKLKLHCDNCAYKTCRPDDLKRHKIIHLKPEEIQYFHCHHCSHKSKRKDYLRVHLSSHFRSENVPFHCYICNFVTLKRDLITKHIRSHSKVQIKCEIKEEGQLSRLYLSSKEADDYLALSSVFKHPFGAKCKNYSGNTAVPKYLSLKRRKIIPGFINQVQPPELPSSFVPPCTPLTVIKNEPPESTEEPISDIKDVDIISHILHDDSIKSETVPGNILETKHLDSLEFGTQVFVKTENAPIVKIENSENLYKTEDTCDRSVIKGTDQGIVEVQGPNEDFYALNNFETNEQLVFNFSTDLTGISVTSRKPKHPEKLDFAKCYRTSETTSWEEDQAKINVIKAPVIPIEPHHYTSLAEDMHFCNNCNRVFNKLMYVKRHIRKMHMDVTRMFQCPCCPFKSKWKEGVRGHVIQKHKDTKDIQWFQCHLCEMKFKLKSIMIEHTKVHLTHEQMQDRMKFCPVCGKGFKRGYTVIKHIRLVHHKMERKCQECEYTTTNSQQLKHHIKNTHEKHEKRYYCEKCVFGTGQYSRLKLHELSHKTEAEMDGQDSKYHCDKCDYKTYRHENFKRHKSIHLKPEEIQHFYCYHCSYKSKQKGNLQTHIFRHFKKGEVNFHCYICDFTTPTRDLIIEHIEKHSKVQIKSEINEGN